MNATKLYLHPIFQTQPPVQVLISHRTMSSSQEQQRITQLEDAIKCACDWLRVNAPGRALEVLEVNMR